MPKILENYKLKLAVEREQSDYEDRFSSCTTALQSPKIGTQSPNRVNPLYEPHSSDHVSITSPVLKSPRSPSNLNSGTYRMNPNNLFQEIMQDRLKEIDQRMAREIASSKKTTKTKLVKVEY